MDGGLTMAFWGVSVLFVLTPGADWAYAISCGVRHGHGALAGVLGLLTGHLAATAAVAVGVAALLAASPAAMTTLTVAGAAYLVWLGAGALCGPVARREPTGDGGTTALAEPRGVRAAYLRGVGVSLLNPKVFLLFLALLPQFTDPHAALPVGTQMFVLGALHVATCAVVYLAVAYGAERVLSGRPRATRAVTVSSGLVMIALGLAVVLQWASAFGS